MKKALFLFLKFLLFFVLFTLLAAFAYMLFGACAFMSAGVRAKLFSLQIFVAGVIRLVPFTSLFALFLVFVSCVRTHNYTVYSACAVALLSVLVFSTVIPLAFNARLNYLESSALGKASLAQQPQFKLSPGYFRKTASGTYYFIEIEDNSYLAVQIPPRQNANKLFETVGGATSALPQNELASDVLIEGVVKMPEFFAYILGALNAIADFAYDAYAKGWFAYFCSASIGFAMLSMWGVAFISSWPLLSVLFVFYTFAGVFALNFMVIATKVFQPVLALLQNWISADISRHVLLLGMNILCFVIFSVAGLCGWIFHRKRSLGEY